MNELRKQDRSAASAPKSQRPDVSHDQRALMPPVDVIEDGNGILLYADLPGVPRERLHLLIEAGTLTIDAEMDLKLPQGLQSSHTEVGLGRFHRTFTLSSELDPERVTAELTNGVLRLVIPKAEHAKPRRIEVSTG